METFAIVMLFIVFGLEIISLKLRIDKLEKRLDTNEVNVGFMKLLLTTSNLGNKNASQNLD